MLDAETSAFGAATSAIARRSFDAMISALDAETSALGDVGDRAELQVILARSFRRYRRLISWYNSAGRFGKSTHIAMISNSVTHLRSYTNSAIADIAGNSAPILPVTPLDCRADISASSADIVTSNDLRAIADVSASSADIVASNDDCFPMF